MGKKELQKIPLFNIFFKRMNILVDRKNKHESHKALLQSAEQVDKGNSMFLYPEGTFNREGKLLPLKKGAFRLAIQKQIPIIPITFIDNWKRMQSGGFFKAKGGPGFTKAIIHKPIDTKGLTEEDLLPLLNKVHTIFATDLQQHGNNE